MKQIFDLFTRAEVEIIVNTGKLSEEQKALFKREGIAQKEAINYAKEVLKYLPSDEKAEAQIEEPEIDEDNYFAPEEEEQAEPTANFEEVAQEQAEEESHPAELLQEIEKVVAEQPAQTTQEPRKKTGKNASERLAMLKKLEELNDKYLKTTQLLTRIEGIIAEHKENETVSLRIDSPKHTSTTITKFFAVDLCLKFVFEETDKQRRAIENEIENLDF